VVVFVFKKKMSKRKREEKLIKFPPRKKQRKKKYEEDDEYLPDKEIKKETIKKFKELQTKLIKFEDKLEDIYKFKNGYHWNGLIVSFTDFFSFFWEFHNEITIKKTDYNKILKTVSDGSDYGEIKETSIKINESFQKIMDFIDTNITETKIKIEVLKNDIKKLDLSCLNVHICGICYRSLFLDKDFFYRWCKCVLVKSNGDDERDISKFICKKCIIKLKEVQDVIYIEELKCPFCSCFFMGKNK